MAFALRLTVLQNEEARGVVVLVLDAFGQDRQSVHLSGKTAADCGCLTFWALFCYSFGCLTRG